MTRHHIYIVTQNDALVRDVESFGGLDFEVSRNPWDAELISSLRLKTFPVIILDSEGRILKIPELISQIHDENPQAKILLLLEKEEMKISSGLRLDAFQLLEKPLNLNHLRTAVRNAVQSYGSERENERLRDIVQDEKQQEYILGKSPAMRQIWSTVSKIAKSDSPVLIEGETGTGKEVLAQAICHQSIRQNGPFIPMNCASLSKELIESELFGHVKGAFTGAVETKKGRFEAADGGTLFLDEIGEISLELQPKLLRVLQDKTFQRVGDTHTRKVDVRILAATNRNLKKAVSDKTFREDLYYRLNVIHITIPPLRERREDIPDLIEFFIARFATLRGHTRISLSADAENFLLNHTYPGNIRELSNMLERAALLCSQDEINLNDILTPVSFQRTANESLIRGKNFSNDDVTNLAAARDQFEVFHLTRLLTLAKGNISLAARLAGIHRNNFKEKMRKFGLESVKFKS